MAYVTIKQYAALYGLQHDSVRHKCLRGGYKTARKMGRDWLIDDNEKPRDLRYRKAGGEECARCKKPEPGSDKAKTGLR